MGQHAYYTLVASLPHLPHFERAERLPISEKRLRERLRMLEADDIEVVRRGVEFLAWRDHPTERTDAEMVSRYQHLMAISLHPRLKEFIDFIIDQRTIMVALRRAHLGLPAPRPGEPWGVGRWVRHIEQHWDDETFKLRRIYPWIPEAKTYLATGDMLKLERLQMNLVWTHVERETQDNYFGIEAVLAYLFKWNLVREWLIHNTDAAKARFAELVAEALHENNDGVR